jgi:L-lactate permease
MRSPGLVVPLTGALCLVQLIRNGGTSSPAYIIGFYMSKWLGKGFIAFAFPLGALGSFFSGSTTISNLTFGDVNKVAALSAGIPVNGLLGLQIAGTSYPIICILHYNNDVLLSRD